MKHGDAVGRNAAVNADVKKPLLFRGRSYIMYGLLFFVHGIYKENQGENNMTVNEWKKTTESGKHTFPEWAVRVYVLILVVIFPFYESNQYFSLLSDRTKFFQYSTNLLVLILLAFFLMQIKKQWTDLWEHIRRRAGENKAICIFGGMLVIAFLFSTLCSEWRMQAWTGDTGRYQGLYMWLLYAAAFFSILLYYKPGKTDFVLFLLAGIVVSSWGIFDYLGYDWFGWHKRVKLGQRAIFMSSIGNINTFTAMAGLYFSTSGGYFILKKEKSVYVDVVCIAAFIVSGIAMFVGSSDNAAIGVLAFFLFLPFAAFRRKEGSGRYFLLSALFCCIFIIVYQINIVSDSPYIDPQGGILLRLCSGKALKYYAAASVLFAFVSFCIFRYKKRWNKKIVLTGYGSLFAAGFLCFSLVIYDANFGENPDKYGVLSRFLVFGDQWGTMRGMVWRLAWESFEKFPFWQKMIGTGPETFGLLMEQNCYEEMVSISGQFYDSPHNELIQYVVCTGIFGAASYYGCLLFCCIKGFKGKPVQMASAVGIVVYTAISLVNISVPITQPFIILLAGFCTAEPQNAQLWVITGK